MKPIIRSTKHFIQFSGTTVAAGAVTNNQLALGIDIVAAATPSHVLTGSTIKAVYIELWVLSLTTGFGNAIVTLEKIPTNGINPVFGNMTALFSYQNKKNILNTTMGLTSGTTAGSPVKLMGGWYKIPKGKQRFGLNDRLMLNVASPINGANLCGVVIFKSYD